MDRYDLALLTLLRALLSRRGSAVLADRTGLPGAVAEILAEKTDDDIRGILLSAHRLAAGSADRLSLLGELACLLPELSESMMRSAPKESAPATDPYALVLRRFVRGSLRATSRSLSSTTASTAATARSRTSRGSAR